MLISFISVKQGERPEIETQPARGVSNCRSSQTIQSVVCVCDCSFAGVLRAYLYVHLYVYAMLHEFHFGGTGRGAEGWNTGSWTVIARCMEDVFA